MSNTGDPIVPPEAPAGAPTVQYREPEDYAELVQMRDALLPHWDDVRPLLEDENLRGFYRGARETYEDQQRRRQQNEIPEVLAPVVKHFEAQWSPVVEYVNTIRSEREAADAKAKADAEAADKAAFEANRAYAQRIMAERAEFRNADGNPSPMMEDLIILASQRKMSIEDAYKEYGPRYFGVKPAAVPREEKKPPTSLRSGDPGVPGESTPPKATTQKERLARMRQNMISAGRGA